MAAIDSIEDARKVRLVEWLTTPPDLREPSSQAKLADELEVSEKTIRNWKNDPTLRAIWEQEAKRIIGDPSNVQEVLEEMRQLALLREVRKGVDKDGMEIFGQNTQQVAAAKLYLQATEAIKPPVADAAAKKAAEMSDAELEAMIAQAAQVELQGRARGN